MKFENRIQKLERKMGTGRREGYVMIYGASMAAARGYDSGRTDSEGRPYTVELFPGLFASGPGFTPDEIAELRSRYRDRWQDWDERTLEFVFDVVK